MRLGIGLGLFKQGAVSVGVRLFSAYKSRVIADGGTVEADNCGISALNNGLFRQASLLLIPSGYKSGKAYAEIPTNGNGDLTWTRASDALRTNSSGLLESMGSGVPRLSYMYGSCPALLLEPQRTNLCLWSQNFDDANWGKTTASVTANQATAPDGTNTMDLLVFSATAGRLTQGVATTNGATYTFSVWLATQSGTQTVEIGNINLGVWQTVTVTTTPTRFSVTQVASSTSRFPGIQSTGAYSILAWGGQCELGAYPTTYIPTTSATATRVADSFSRSNIYTNGLITSSGGTWFVELRGNVEYTRDNANRIGITDNTGTFANSLVIFPNTTGRYLIAKMVSGSTTTLHTTTTNTTKFAIKWNGTSCDVFANGTKVVSASSFTTTIMENLATNSAGIPTFIQAMGLHPTPLTDAQCIEITSL